MTLTTWNLYQHLIIYGHSSKSREPARVETLLIKLPVHSIQKSAQSQHFTSLIQNLCILRYQSVESLVTWTCFCRDIPSLLWEVTYLHTVWKLASRPPINTTVLLMRALSSYTSVVTLVRTHPSPSTPGRVPHCWSAGNPPPILSYASLTTLAAQRGMPLFSHHLVNFSGAIGQVWNISYLHPTGQRFLLNILKRTLVPLGTVLQACICCCLKDFSQIFGPKGP